MAARLIETGSHVALPLPGRVHGKQLARLCELIQELTDRNGGWGKVHLDIRGRNYQRHNDTYCSAD